MQDKSRTKPLMRQMIEMNGTGFLVWWIRYQLRATAFFLPPGALWEHVRIFKCLVATQSHDVGLNVRCKCLNIVRQNLAMFLALSPVRVIFMEVCHKPVLLMKSESVSSVVLPPDVHGRQR